MSSAKLRSIELTIYSFMSLIKIMKRIGPVTVPWGTPLITLETDDFTPFTATYWSLSSRKDSIHWNTLPVTPKALSFFSSS